ncbi:polymer-forming cytoskeletal protein [Bacillus sp. C28GYM-DRY-1]|uniref:bactofilin family protein n=1 Tax=Bacillus sp. C28GYM-DRY-1 TaxID=3062686 RepID=UPI002674967A|nr:polymer-forming cytoskeletal protein [Bacillus sp. C28GYM-DRY-1]MDO3662893.1 polymer-forming cytoskeletal protein [Bacillus sp. C28GYM-DRY-1]
MDVMEKLVINGSGSSKGGTFQSVEINGSGTVAGDVECDTFSFNGTGTADGSVKAKAVTISGSGKIHGDVEAKFIRINGTGIIEGEVSAKQLKIAGSTTIGGTVKADNIVISGKAVMEADCETETFQSEGKCKVSGLLNVDQVFIKLSAGESYVREIGCRHLQVTGRKGMLTLLRLLPQPVLTAELIEGDEIDLTNTKAKTVRGNKVKIGPNCQIEAVEYSGVYTCDPSASVETCTRM